MADDVDSLFAPATSKSAKSANKAPVIKEGDGDAALLSKLYFDRHRLEPTDKILDGFTDLGTGQQFNSSKLGSERIIVDRDADEKLDIFVTKAMQKLQKASDTVTALMAAALLVSDSCGRSGDHAKDLVQNCQNLVAERADSQGRIALGEFLGENAKKKKVPGAGLVRHRALSFKVLADFLEMAECTLERNSTGTVAWNTVNLDVGAFVVDLMHDPGALYEAQSAKQASYLGMLESGTTMGETISTQTQLGGYVPRPPWHVDPGDLDWGKGAKDRLGRGGFGEVLKGRWCGVNVAIKVIRDKSPTDYDVLDFILEIALLSRLNHPNVMRFWRGCVELKSGKRALLMVTEFISMGGLSQLLHGHGGPAHPEALTMPQVLSLNMGIARGMQYLHSCYVLHLDLKSPNVLVDHDWVPKLCDFGLAKIRQNTEDGEHMQTTIRGVSPIWAPPEMFDNRAEGMTDKADVYSYGIVFFELAARKLPFSEISQQQLPKAKFEGVLPKIPSEVPSDCVKLINNCLAANPKQRPSMPGVIAQIAEIAKARQLNLAEVQMPTKQTAGETEAQREIAKQVDNQRKKIDEDKAVIAAQLEKTRARRMQLQDQHLGAAPLASQGTMGLAPEEVSMSVAPDQKSGGQKKPAATPANSGAANGAGGNGASKTTADPPAKQGGCCTVL